MGNVQAIVCGDAAFVIEAAVSLVNNHGRNVVQ
jgi:hypothetical protein